MSRGQFPAFRTGERRPLPAMVRVRQRFETGPALDIRGAIAEGFRRHGDNRIGPGRRVAITAGSRGIANGAAIVRAVVEEVRGRGGEPCVVAAMGSHGGATAEGQRQVLAGYGITEDAIGCAVISSMETVCLGETEGGFPVFIDRAAHGCDAIVLLNRVKPHSSLTGDLGSGLMKMAAIGLGKREGADSIHRMGLAEHLLPAARMVLERAPIALGVAVVEDGRDETSTIEVVPAAEIEAADRRLLREARRLLPTIPFDPLDVLIVDRIGKNISGTGMDPNVIGMHRRIGGAPAREIGRIVALDLSEESHGNALGMGMADIVTEQLRAKIDWPATYMNAATSGFLVGARLPLVCAEVEDAITLALHPFEPERARVARIRDTAHLEEFWVTAALLAEIDRYPGMEQVSEADGVMT